MMRSSVRRVRLLAAISFGICVIWLWNRNSAMMDVYRKHGAQLAVGGGSVLRPDLQKPEMHEPPPAFEQESPTTEPERPAEEPTIDELLHSDAAMVDHEVKPTTSSTSASTPATTSASASKAPSFPIADEEEDYGTPIGAPEVDPYDPAPIKVHWEKQPDLFPLSTTRSLPTETSIPFPRIQRAVKKLEANGADKERLKLIKAAASDSWKGYTMFALPQDEVKPVSQTANNPFNGWGATLVDSLDTLWIMGLKAEFEEAIQSIVWIDFTTSLRSDIPLFETVIRYLGGLIGAYDVSERKHKILLDQAKRLAEVLYDAFDTPNRMPLTYYRWKPSSTKDPHRAGNRVILAEIGTLSLEFTRLAQLTGEQKYYDAIARITDRFEEWQNNTRLPGMWPTAFDASGCGLGQRPGSTIPHRVHGSVDTKAQAAPQAVSHGELHREGQPGTLDDDGMGVHEAEKHLFNEDAHGNTYKLRRQLDSTIEESETENEIKQSLADQGVHVDSNQGHTGTATLEDFCEPQGFVSGSKNGQESYTLSGASDSMYEYLTKEYLLLGGTVDQYRTMFLQSMDVAMKKLVYKPMSEDERDILLTGDLKLSPDYSQPGVDGKFIERFTPEAAHLACFTGGMFAMGGIIFDRPDYLTVGSKLTDGCVWMYNITATGIMPEQAVVTACKDTWGECPWDEKAYWAALDPYRDTREGSASQTPASTSGNSRAPHEEIRHPHGNTRVGKRQLEVPDDSESTSSASVSSTASSSASSTSSSSSTASATAAAETSVALTHEEFVQQRIETDRLPPGVVSFSQRKYILRPEAIESVFYMYRITGDNYWREVGWNMWTSISKHTRASFGFSAIDDVSRDDPNQVDSMESFWIAETLKYFYLLYDDPKNWSLDDWVLNTEAHLFRRPAYKFAEDQSRAT